MCIVGKAEPAVFTSADISLYPDSYTLAWTAESKSDISTFLVQFKESRSSKWTSMEVTATRSPNRLWQGTALLSHLQSAAQYDFIGKLLFDIFINLFRIILRIYFLRNISIICTTFIAITAATVTRK